MTLPGHEQKLPLNSEITVVEDRWEVVCRGSYQRSDVLHLIDSISEQRDRRPDIGKCLVDVAQAEISLGIMGEYVIGEHAARQLAGLRIAVFQSPGQIKKLMEDTAYNRGLRISLVDSLRDALAWLDK